MVVMGEENSTQEGVARVLPQYKTVNQAMRMRKMLEVMVEAVRSQNPLFRKPASLPRKSQKHRYERRKIKEFIHLMDGQTESTC
jgi:hypothetical protein